MNAENIILAGVWQGTGKPPMDIILSSVLTKIQELFTKGINIQSLHFHGIKTVRAKLLLSVFDLPARASATNFLQFNGNFSCLYCYDKGTHILHRQVFLPDEQHEPRTNTDIKQHAIQAEEEGRPIFGVKGKSILSSSLDMVSAIPVDYMHAALEGISRRLLSLVVSILGESLKKWIRDCGVLNHLKN